VYRYLSIATTVANLCGPVVSPRTGRRLGSPPREQSPRTLHHRADAGPCIVECLYFDFAPAMFYTRTLCYLCSSFVTQELM
jgi:hypothetical protein